MTLYTTALTIKLSQCRRSLNCYIPITANKSKTTKPCLAIRHNNTNYYVIK